MNDYKAELTAMSAGDWGKVLAGFDDACIEQTYEYSAARVGADRLRHLVVHRAGAPVAATQIVLMDPPVLPGGVAFVKFGPVWRGNARAPDASDLAAAARLLRAQLVDEQGLMLRLMPPAYPGLTELTEQTLQANQFSLTPIDHAERYFIDLSRELPQLRENLKPKWRYHLKRAEQRGMSVSRSNDMNDLVPFAELYRQMRRRKAFVEGPTPENLPALFAELPPATMPQIFMCSHDGDIVAGAIIATIGDTAVYLFGASNEQGAALRAGYYLHWHAMQWLQTTACRWYDLGGDCGDTGLRRFKSGLAGKAAVTPALPGYFDAQGSLPSRLAGQLAFGLRDATSSARQWFARQMASRSLF